MHRTLLTVNLLYLDKNSIILITKTCDDCLIIKTRFQLIKDKTQCIRVYDRMKCQTINIMCTIQGLLTRHKIGNLSELKTILKRLSYLMSAEKIHIVRPQDKNNMQFSIK